ncbi:MAG: type IV pilus modification PilV family protein [Rhodospirillales bacterium]
MSARRRHPRQRGFGLFELLVALALVAGTAAAAFRIMGGATRGAGDAERYTRAALLAESRMAELGAADPLRPGEATGESGDGFLWRVSVRPFPTQQSPPAPGAPAVLQLTVTVVWGAEERPGEVSLTTLRLAPRPR